MYKTTLNLKGFELAIKAIFYFGSGHPAVELSELMILADTWSVMYRRILKS